MRKRREVRGKKRMEGSEERRGERDPARKEGKKRLSSEEEARKRQKA